MECWSDGVLGLNARLDSAENPIRMRGKFLEGFESLPFVLSPVKGWTRVFRQNQSITSVLAAVCLHQGETTCNIDIDF